MKAATKPVVLFVSLPRALGGSNRSLVTLLESLEGQVERVVASPHGGRFAEFATERSAVDEWVTLYPKGPLARVRRMIDGMHVAAWSVRNRKRLQCIHANATTGLLVSAFAGMLSRRPVVVWVHDPVSTPWGRRLGPWVARIVPDLTVAAVSVTAESVAVDMGLCSTGDATIVPNPIDPLDIVFEDKEVHDGVRIAILGGTTPRKGFDLLPEVVAGLHDLPVSWDLYVNPEPSDVNADTWDDLGPYLGSVVEVPGRTNDVRQAYAAADIVFCPSREESFCRVAAEAMMNGIPVVGSDIEPLEFLLGDGAGALFRSGDAGDAVTAIRGLVVDAERRVAAGEVGRRRSEAFLPSGVATAMLYLYGIDGTS